MLHMSRKTRFVNCFGQFLILFAGMLVHEPTWDGIGMAAPALLAMGQLLALSVNACLVALHCTFKDLPDHTYTKSC